MGNRIAFIGRIDGEELPLRPLDLRNAKALQRAAVKHLGHEIDLPTEALVNYDAWHRYLNDEVLRELREPGYMTRVGRFRLRDI